MRSTFDIFSQPLELPSKEASGLEKILQRYGKAGTPSGQEPRWDASVFGYDRSSAFGALSADAAQALLKRRETSILGEIQMIEVAGMAYTAHMVGIVPDEKQRELYSHFAGDEARHYRLVTTLLGKNPAPTQLDNSFLKLIAQIIDSESYGPLVFFIQVVLEGWGIHYYGGLSRTCRDSATKEVLESIVADEAGHHGSGLILFDESKLGNAEEQRVRETFQVFVDAIRLGPAAVSADLAQALGGMKREDLERFLKEIRFEEKVKKDLDYLRSVLQKSKALKLYHYFDAKGAFAPVSLHDCVNGLMPFCA